MSAGSGSTRTRHRDGTGPREVDGIPAANATWNDITPVARRDWIHGITSGRKAETRVKRIAVACDQLASGKRRACCFDRSGLYSKGNMGAAEAAE